MTRAYDLIIHEFSFWKLITRVNKLKGENRIFFFFPFYHTGGAEIVHLNIVRSVSDQPSVTFFTLPSGDEGLKPDFYETSQCLDIHSFIREKRLRRILLKQLSRIINKRTDAVVFGCHSHLFYELLPHLNDRVKRIDLIHAFTGVNEPGYEKDSQPFVEFLNTRIVISNHAKKALQGLYASRGLQETLINRVKVIYNATDLAGPTQIEKNNEPFTILYVGRNSPEKRIHLIGQIATKLKKFDSNFEVVFIGAELYKSVKQLDQPNCLFTGPLTQEELIFWYQKAHAVLISSEREGFPMVFMESMKFGCIPISTEVGAIPELLKHQENALLIPVMKNEEELINSFLEKIQQLYHNEEERKRISKNAYVFSNNAFNLELFRKSYRTLFGISP